MDKVLRIIIENATKGNIDKKVAGILLSELKNQIAKGPEDIAVIGMSSMLPVVKGIDEFWDNIKNGADFVGKFPESRREDIDRYLKYINKDEDLSYIDGSYFSEIDKFDSGFFKIPPKEADLMDPFQRMFLETSWRALEDAGYASGKVKGSRTGVYVGFASNIKDSYLKFIQDVDVSLMTPAAVGNITAMIPTRIAYHLDLKGPTMVIDTACSSSLVAVHLACEGIRSGDCEMAIAGGIRVNLLPLDREYYKGGIESSDGRTKAFDDGSDGSGMSEGISAVLLKPLSKAVKDRDNIYAVIKGSAINQDGASIGITAPNPDSQADVIARAWEQAGINPETLSFIEAHGTGTRLGDPLELDGLESAFRRYTDKKQICPIGTVKSNLGHPYECAGIIGLIKSILAIREKEIPKTIHFGRPNSKFDFSNSPVFVNTRPRKLETKNTPIRCAVSSFGFSGTNCHMVLEEAPERKPVKRSNPPYAACISAKGGEMLPELIKSYREFFADKGKDLEPGDVCYTLNAGRGHYGSRAAFIFESMEDFNKKLDALCSCNGEFKEIPWLYQGQHKIVSESKEEKKAFEITEWNRIEMNGQSQEKLKDFVSGGKADRQALCEILGLYVKGADVEWEELYTDEDVNKVSLPPYPLKRNRCWMDIPETAEDKSTLDDFYYSMNWKEEQISTENTETDQDSFLVFKDDEGLWEGIWDRLKRDGHDVTGVSSGSKFEKAGDGEYIVSGMESDYIELFNSIGEKNISKIIHLSTITCNTSPESLEELKASQERGIYSLFHITRAISGMKINKNIKLFLLSRNVNEVTGNESCLCPHNAPFLGIGKVIGREHPEIRCCSVDLDEYAGTDEIMGEIYSEGKDYISAYRQGKRYIEEFTPVDLMDHGNEKPELREDGVYVVTGGLGGIGLETARYLSSENKVNIAFINRTPMPLRENWDEIVEKGESPKLIDRIKRIREIEANGTKVVCLASDVADLKKMSDAFSRLRKEFGRINGIIHGAGVGGDVLIKDRDPEDFNRVISPKIYGTWVLDSITKDDDPDFFVMYSSVATMFSAITQGDYVAANSFMDAFSSYRNRQGKKTVTINWTTWKETGMSVEAGFTVDTIFKTILTKQAISGFGKVLGSNLKRVLIGQLNYDGGGIYMLDRVNVRLSGALKESIEDYKNKKASRTVKRSNSERKSSGEVSITGRSSGDYDEIERTIARACKEVLGFDEIDIFENFFELGADSISLVRILAMLENEVNAGLSVTDLFQYSSITKLAQYIKDKSEKSGIRVLEKIKTKDSSCPGKKEIAIIGMSLRLPMAYDPDDFWDIIKDGVDCIKVFPEDRRRDMDRYIEYSDFPLKDIDYKKGAYLEGIDGFDYNFFRLSPKEASLTDPNQRLFLQTAWNAIEDSGYGGGKLSGTNTGVYLGYSSNVIDVYSRLIYEYDISLYPNAIVGNTPAVATGRISYLLDLKGPSMVVDTACSSSLVAIHTACKAINNGECDMAIAGGIKISTLPVTKKSEKMDIGMDASDGRTRAFDDNSDGTGYGEGVIALVLKPMEEALKDRDNIYAVIKGSAVNQDGSSAGITAPNPAAQEEVIVKAWEDAGVEPETISYIEAHGTGTQLGDPIEIKGIQGAFERFTDKKQFCAVGSVKTNIGHLSEGAGIAGIVKAVLALRNKQIPPTVNFNKPNKKIDFIKSPIYISTRTRDWDKGETPRRCGVSGFGISGTNCHIVLEEAPQLAESPSMDTGLNVLTVSAKNKEALLRMLKSYADHFKKVPRLSSGDICFTANTARGHYNHRTAIIIRDFDDLKLKIAGIFDKGLENMEAPWFFYREHKVVSKEKQSDSMLEISEKEVMSLGETANEKILRFNEGGNASMEILSEICSLYVTGGEVDWKKLYNESRFKKIRLPAYSFDSKRCWLEMPEVRESLVSPLRNEMFYSVVWNEHALEASGPEDKKGAVLIIGTGHKIPSNLAEGLKNKGNKVLTADFGPEPSINEGSGFTIRNRQEDYDRLMLEVRARGVNHIVHAASLDFKDDVVNAGELLESQRIGVHSLFYLSKAIMKAGINENINLILLTEGANEVSGREKNIKPWNATMAGLGKVIGQEDSRIAIRCIDMDDLTDPLVLLEEIFASTYAYNTAYRENKRFMEEFRDMDTGYKLDREVEIKDEGVYIITGGTGGIGLEIAKYLASKNKVKLAFINRSEIPDRCLWNDILAREEDMRLCKKIRGIRSIESMGAQVSCFQADMADPGQVSCAVGKIKDVYGTINGVVLSSGTAGDGFLVKKEESSFNEVLYPKVLGTWAIDEATKEDNLDFFIMFSSVATIYTGMGQGDYSAANSFLDAYTLYRNRKGKKTLTINWVAWKETGMAVDYGVNTDGAFRAITTEQAIQGFDEVLNKEIDRVLIGELNYGAEVLYTLDLQKLPVGFSYKICSIINKNRKRVLESNKAQAKKQIGEVKLLGKQEGYSDTEEKLAQIYSEILGYEEININDGFFELGGDSILISKLHMRLEEIFPGKASLMDLFEYASISRLSGFITSKVENQPKKKIMDDAGIEEELQSIIGKMKDGNISLEEALRNLKVM